MKKFKILSIITLSLILASFTIFNDDVKSPCEQITVTNNSLEKKNITIKNRRGNIVSAFSLSPKGSQTVTMASGLEEVLALTTSNESFSVYAAGKMFGKTEVSGWSCDYTISQ